MKKTCNCCVSRNSSSMDWGPEWHENCKNCGDDLKNWIWRGHADKYCSICGRILARGITIQSYGDGFAHPECVEGKRRGVHIPIDHGD